MSRIKLSRVGIAAGLVALGLCGCATPYRPMNHGQGFTDSQIGPDEFVVAFQGNGNTHPDQANDYALLRAAEVTLEHGFSFFEMTNITNTSSARPYVVRQQFHTDYPVNMGLPPPSPFGLEPYQFGYIAEYEQPAVYVRPGERLWIRCFKSKPEKPFTYDAAALAQSIRQKYKLKPDRG